MAQIGNRFYNLDLLRIVAMLMIVILHFLSNAGGLSMYPDMSLKSLAIWGLWSTCLVAVNCYVFISGYFLISSTFKVKKVISLVLQVLFYSIGLYVLLMTIGIAKFSVNDFFNALFPTLSGVYWFISVYMALYILSPFLNKLLLSFSKRMHLIFITVLIGIFSLWPTLFVLGDKFTYPGLNITGGYSAIWFIVLYCVAAYLRLHYKPSHGIQKDLVRYVIIAASVILLFAASSFLGAQLHVPYFSALFAQMSGYNSLPIFIASVALFLVFVNLRISSRLVNRLIATLAPLTLGVYLIHQEPHVRQWLWSTFNTAAHAYSPRFLLYAVSVVFGIYFACSLIEWVRLQLFKQLAKLSVIQRLGVVIETCLKQIFRWSIRLVEKAFA